MYDMMIIGAGPGGMGAAIYAKRAGMDVAVIDPNPISGGQILYTSEIDNYLGLPGINGFDLGMKFKEHADYLNIPMIGEEVLSLELEGNVKKVVTSNKEYKTRTVVLAMGANHRKLGVSGEEEFVGKGVSYCATCDGAFFRGKNVAVVGGGDAAVTDALVLSKLCNKVTLIHRRDSLKAAKSLQEKLYAAENVEIIWNSSVTQISGEGSVNRIAVSNMEKGTNEEILVDGIFIAVGITPNNKIIKNLLPCDEAGYIIAGEDTATAIPGVAVVGDLRTKKMRQIITAVADGANAVATLETYLMTLNS